MFVRDMFADVAGVLEHFGTSYTSVFTLVFLFEMNPQISLKFPELRSAVCIIKRYVSVLVVVFATKASGIY